ncbi:MAG: hypothetical protein K2Q33_03440 [Gammaproteobacteria bacterium]|nr:hypothetical protein [Gammaproteobacteria bacterium]
MPIFNAAVRIVVREVFRRLERLGINRRVTERTIENVNSALERLSLVRPEQVNNLIETLDRTLNHLAAIDPNAINDMVDVAGQAIRRINASNIIENIDRIAYQIGNVPLIEGANLFLRTVPFFSGIQAIASLVSMGFGIGTYFEIREFRKTFEREIQLFREELHNYFIQNMEIAQEIRDILRDISEAIGYQNREHIDVRNINRNNIRIFYEERRYIESVEQSNAFLDSMDDRAFYYRGLSLYRLGYYFSAAENLMYAYRVQPANSEPLYWRGLSLLRLGFMEAAKRDFDTVVAKNPNWLTIVVNAHIYLASQDYENAIRQYTQVIEQNNQDFLEQHDIHCFLGIAYMKSRNYRQAIDIFNTAIGNAALDIAQKIEFFIYCRECYKLLGEAENADNIFNLITQLFRNDNNTAHYLEKIRHYEAIALSPEEMQYAQWISVNNTAITSISIHDVQQRRKNFSDILFLFTLRNAAFQQPAIEYILSDLYIRNGELIIGFRHCAHAKANGNIPARNTISKCFELLDPELPINSMPATPLHLENIQVEGNIVINCAAVSLFRGLFNLETNMGAAIRYFTSISAHDKFAQLMLGHYYQYGHLYIEHEDNNHIIDYPRARAYYAYDTTGTMNITVIPHLPNQTTLSEYYLAIMYYHGKGIGINIYMACTLYKRAFLHGRGIPRIEFAKAFYYGVNISADYQFAFEIFDACLRIYPRNSVEYKEAQYHKGRMLYLGQHGNAVNGMDEGKELLIANAENDDINSALMLSAIFARERNNTKVRQYKKRLPHDFTRIIQFTSIACNQQFFIHAYREGNDLCYNFGQFTAPDNGIAWNPPIRAVTNGRHPSITLGNQIGNQNRVCLVLEKTNRQLYYTTGVLQQNTILWGNLFPLNIQNAQFPKIAIYNDIIVLVYSTGWYTLGRIGKLLENNSIEWGENFPCIHNTDAPSLAVFQRHNQIKVIVVSACSKGKLFYNIANLQYDPENVQNSRVNWHFLFGAAKLNVLGYYPSICINKLNNNEVWLTYCETKNTQASSFLNCLKGTLATDFLGDLYINWEAQPKTYSLGNFPTIACRANGKIIEFHGDLGGFISAPESVFNPREPLAPHEIPHNPILPIYLVTFFLYLDIDLDNPRYAFWTNLAFYLVGINGNWNINESWKMHEQGKSYNITIPIEFRAEGYTMRYKFRKNNMPQQAGRWLPGGHAENDQANLVFRIPENAPRNHLIVSYCSGNGGNVELRHSDNGWEQGELLDAAGRGPSIYRKHMPFSFNEFRFFKPQRNEWRPAGDPIVANFRRENILRPGIG